MDQKLTPLWRWTGRFTLLRDDEIASDFSLGDDLSVVHVAAADASAAVIAITQIATERISRARQRGALSTRHKPVITHVARGELISLVVAPSESPDRAPSKGNTE